ncbi:Frag1/DRAM/Sfk1 family [Geosmithia morbida]|uniref:Frag1/DRAM/Sfk1 family n=1 Tax=Geosmithia morbida TaxID=1094350 RepID=A0A9P4YSH2_9HYPO|nr:Frag1/DRAM/Sfk1 family [Geosmithia morbida]KAF4120179.1 Frag1/DRAM/Sfk1 family [Geosmithia morbida]
MAVKGAVSYWWLPIIACVTWTATLLGMMLWWFVTVHQKVLVTMDGPMPLPYMSDIGALSLKPLFIAGSTVTVVAFSLAFAAERWLRHRGRLALNVSKNEKILAVLATIFAIIGSAGLILLTVFDTLRHHTLHYAFLGVFIGGFIISAIFVCWEYQRLGSKYPEYPLLRVSFFIKLVFIFIEASLVIAFGVLTLVDDLVHAAYLEWTISFLFGFYALSFTVDLWPARRTKEHIKRFTRHGQYSSSEMEEAVDMPDGSYPLGTRANQTTVTAAGANGSHTPTTANF